jgi:hypothetical protein
VLNNLSCCIDHAAGRVHLDQDGLIVLPLRFVNRPGDVFRTDGLDRVVDHDLKNSASGSRRTISGGQPRRLSPQGKEECN